MSKITAKTKMCIIIGDPVEHSLSPKMHNSAYEAFGIDDQFVFTAAKVDISRIKEVVEAVRIMGIRGLTCTIPHKIEVMKYLDEIDLIAERIGAVNTVVNNDGVLTGYNTDWLGALEPLDRFAKKHFNLSEESIFPLQGKKVALIGAGGASRAMAYAIVRTGAQLKIFNRTKEAAKELAEWITPDLRIIEGMDDRISSKISKIPVEFAGLEDINEISDHDVIVNSTSLGMGENIDKSPVPIELLNKNQIVFDAVYVPYETKLLRDAKSVGATIIHGIEMLLQQGTAQFELYTGHKAPEEVMKKSLFEHFGINE